MSRIALFLLCGLLACSKRDSQKVSNKLYGSDLTQIVEQGFVDFDEHYFSPQDSCWFRSFVSQDFRLDSISYSVIDDIRIYSCNSEALSFSFTVLEKDDTYFYYGHSDVYNLMFNKSLSNDFQKFENKALTNIVNKVFQHYELNDDDKFKIVKKLIFELYNFSINGYNIPFAQIPIEESKGASNKHLFDSVPLPMDDNTRIVLFESEIYGSICFMIRFNDQSIVIEELIKPTSPRTLFLKSDIVPEEYKRNCF